MLRRRACHAISSLLCVGMTWSVPALAESEDDRVKARALYEQASEAYRAGRHVEAARLLLEADRKLPNDVTLAAALEAAARGDDPLVALEAADRAERSPKFGAQVDALRAAFESRVGQIVVRCPGTTACLARIDHVAVPPEVPVRQTVGKHLVERVVSGKVAVDAVMVTAGQLHEVSGWPDASVTQAPEPEEANEGISPAWFFLGVGLTVAAAAGTIGSGVETLARHDSFRAAPSDEARERGQAAQLRTNLLLGLTAVCAGTSVLLALFTDWGSDGGPEATLRFGPTGFEGTLRF